MKKICLNETRREKKLEVTRSNLAYFPGNLWKSRDHEYSAVQKLVIQIYASRYIANG